MKKTYYNKMPYIASIKPAELLTIYSLKQSALIAPLMGVGTLIKTKS